MVPVSDQATEPTEGPDSGATPSFGAHPVLVYTLQRLGMLLAVGAVLYVVGLRDVWLVLFAFLVSGVISAFVLKGSREGASYGITGAVKRVNERIDAAARAEDVDDVDDLGPVQPTAADEVPGTPSDGEQPSR